MGYYILIANKDEFDFVRVNGKIKRFYQDSEIIDALKRASEVHGSDNVTLIKNIPVTINTEILLPK